MFAGIQELGPQRTLPLIGDIYTSSRTAAAVIIVPCDDGGGGGGGGDSSEIYLVRNRHPHHKSSSVGGLGLAWIDAPPCVQVFPYERTFYCML